MNMKEHEFESGGFRHVAESVFEDTGFWITITLFE